MSESTPALAQVTIQLDSKAVLSRAQRSALGQRLQGALLELLDEEFVASVHRSVVNPYSQHVLISRNQGSRPPLRLIDRIDAPEPIDGTTVDRQVNGTGADTSKPMSATPSLASALNRHSQERTREASGLPTESQGPSDVTTPVGTSLVWKIGVLTQTAKAQIVPRALDPDLTSIFLKSMGTTWEIVGRDLQEMSVEDHIGLFYQPQPPDLYSLTFLTPTAFRQRGRYASWADPRLIMQSLAMKHSAIFHSEEPEEELLDELAHAIRIQSFAITSRSARIEQTSIVGFVGQIKFRVIGPTSLKAYVAMLLEFGNYSGCGIKTSMGMGAVVSSIRQSRKES